MKMKMVLPLQPVLKNLSYKPTSKSQFYENLLLIIKLQRQKYDFRLFQVDSVRYLTQMNICFI